MLTREQILAMDDLQTEVVDVKEWAKGNSDGKVTVREATAEERDAYFTSLFRHKVGTDKPEMETDFANSQARLVVCCVVDDDGNRLFTDADAERLGKKSSRAITKLFRVIQRLSGMDKKSEEDIERNFGKGRSVDSPSS